MAYCQSNGFLSVPYARLTPARLWATILSWQVGPFWGTNWEAAALFTISSRIGHDEFTNACPSASTLTRTGTTSSRIVYALPALARRVCAIRTVACRLEAPQSLVIFGLSRSSCELILNYSWHFVPVRGMARIETHWHASSRIVPTCSRRVHEQAAHSSRPGRDILS